MVSFTVTAMVAAVKVFFQRAATMFSETSLLEKAMNEGQPNVFS